MLTRLRQYRDDFLAILLLALIVIAFFFPLWGQGGWLPLGGGDAVSFLYPMYRFIAASFQNGEIPLWNPHQYAGYPLIADNQAGMFYPFNLILFFLKPDFGYQWIQVLVGWHIFWAGLGTYLVVRMKDEGRRLNEDEDRQPITDNRLQITAALVAAVAFMFSDVFITHLGNLNLIAVASWLPWAFLAFRHALRSRLPISQSPSLLFTGLAIGISTLAGHGQMTFYIAFFLGIYALWRTVFARDWMALPKLAIVGLIGFGLSALTLLPTYEMNELTRRGAFSYEQTVNYSLPWQGLVGILAPGFFGRNAATFYGTWLRVEFGYLGATTLLLALWGIKRRRFNLFLALGTIFFLILSLGSNTPVHRLVFEWAQLPFQVPARFVLLMNFCLALLAAQGVKKIAETDLGKGKFAKIAGFILIGILTIGLLFLSIQDQANQSQALIATLIFSVFSVIAWLVITHAPEAAKGNRKLAALLLLLVVEIFVTSQYVEVDWGNPLSGYENSAAIDYLREQSDINRIDEATDLWQASSAQVNGLYSAGGVFNPLELASHAVYMGAVGYRGSPTYSLIGIKHIVADKTNPPGDTAFIIPVNNTDPQVDIYLNTNALPRLMMLYDSVNVTSHDEAFKALHSELDFSKTVIVENGELLSGEVAEHKIELLEYGLNRVVVNVTTEAQGYLLLTDTWYPDWVAEVDGESGEILRANYTFRTILLDPGEHLIEMRFQPTSWRIGLAITAITWAAIITLSIFAKTQRLKDAKKK